MDLWEQTDRARIELIRDVLDDQVVDRNGEKMGRVDGLIMELREFAPPLLTCIEIGGPTLAARVSPRFGRWVEKLSHRFGPGGETYRIPWGKVRHTGINVDVDLTMQYTSVGALERWLNEHIVRHIPGAG